MTHDIDLKYSNRTLVIMKLCFTIVKEYTHKYSVEGKVMKKLLTVFHSISLMGFMSGCNGKTGSDSVSALDVTIMYDDPYEDSIDYYVRSDEPVHEAFIRSYSADPYGCEEDIVFETVGESHISLNMYGDDLFHYISMAYESDGSTEVVAKYKGEVIDTFTVNTYSGNYVMEFDVNNTNYTIADDEVIDLKDYALKHVYGNDVSDDQFRYEIYSEDDEAVLEGSVVTPVKAGNFTAQIFSANGSFVWMHFAILSEPMKVFEFEYDRYEIEYIDGDDWNNTVCPAIITDPDYAIKGISFNDCRFSVSDSSIAEIQNGFGEDIFCLFFKQPGTVEVTVRHLSTGLETSAVFTACLSGEMETSEEQSSDHC